MPASHSRILTLYSHHQTYRFFLLHLAWIHLLLLIASVFHNLVPAASLVSLLVSQSLTVSLFHQGVPLHCNPFSLVPPE